MEINNRKAHYNYFIEDTYIAGIVLKGHEVKSLRAGNANISESFCTINENDVYVINSYIKQYMKDWSNYDETHQRKLLLTKKEIKKINKFIQLPGYSLIPLKIFFDEHQRAKMLIGICKGKHDYDKRESIKQKDLDRESHQKL